MATSLKHSFLKQKTKLLDLIHDWSDFYHNDYDDYDDDFLIEDISDSIYDKLREVNNYPAIGNSPGLISFSRDLSKPFEKKSRVNISLARFVRRNLKITSDEICDSNLEIFETLFKFKQLSNTELVKQIKVLKGKDLVAFYATTKAGSCMTGKAQSNYIKFYGNNPTKVSLITYKNEARALLWKTKKGKFYIDRVYSTSVIGSYIIRKYAKLKKYNSCWSDYDDINSVNEDYVEMKPTDKYPCLDSFSFGRLDKKENIIYLQTGPRNYFSANVELCCTNGGLNTYYD